MGLIGWAEAPSSELDEGNLQSRDGSLNNASEELDSGIGETFNFANNYGTQIAAGADSGADSHDDGEVESCANAYEKAFVGTVVAADQVPNHSGGQSAENSCTRTENDIAPCELFEAIRALRLSPRSDETGLRCDISGFELHEVKFLFDHAERLGFSDYYGVVREVFAVKHKILDEVDDIDRIESPNLDELMAFAEEKYEQSFRGEDS